MVLSQNYTNGEGISHEKPQTLTDQERKKKPKFQRGHNLKTPADQKHEHQRDSHLTINS